MINYLINELLAYGIKNNLISDLDEVYSANLLINLLKLDKFSKEEVTTNRRVDEILDDICDYAYQNNIIDSQDKTITDLFDAQIMNTIMPRPNEVQKTFNNLYKQSPTLATDYFYDLSFKSNYIRKNRIDKNINFKYASSYGNLDITINLSKPEKDPKIIALAKSMKQTDYPKCMLCKEAMGFYGNLNYPGRTNHRIIPLSLNGNRYYLQYSPYVYYDEHCIVFNDSHVPMEISKKTFANLVEFVDLFPDYFMGSNADLPIVGGSILTHDHYQGGKYEFAMFKANDLYVFGDVDNVKVSYINWPLDTIKLQSNNKEDIINLSTKILDAWRKYSNEEINLVSYTKENHNTITPILKKEGNLYVMYLVLRNNLCNEANPYGLFHPNTSLHHIKKENIGLIEVMGLAVLPQRLKEEMEEFSKVLVNHDISALDSELLSKHKDWYYEICNLHDYNENNVHDYLNEEIGKVFVKVLEDCSVFKYGNKIAEMKKFVSSFLNGGKA